MVERICPSCQHGNPLEDRFCGKCGVPLERQLPMRRPDAYLTIAGHNLPVTWKQFSRTVALSVAALAAEAGLAWLRRRMDSSSSATALIPSKEVAPPRTAAAETTTLAGPVRNVVTIVSQRVVEISDGGDGTRRVVEQNFWRQTEE